MSTTNILLAALLLVTLLVFLRMRPPTKAIQHRLDLAIERLGSATQHYMEVNAVLALTRNFTDDPGLSERLAGYSRQVVSATLAYRVNCLGEQLRAANDQLGSARRKQGEFGSTYNADVTRLGKIATELGAELAAANAAAEMFAVEH